LNKTVCDVSGCDKQAFTPRGAAIDNHGEIRLVGRGVRDSRSHGPYSFDLCQEHYVQVVKQIHENLSNGNSSEA
jgi:hypothetical protein